MGTRMRRTATPVAELLFLKTKEFQFVQAVRILKKLQPSSLSLETCSRPNEGPVIFKSHVSFAFKSSDLYSLTTPASGPPLLTVNFMGIAGNSGPLPAPYMQMVINRSNQFDNTFKDFLDIFNHRLITLLYAIRKKYRMGIDEIPAEDTSVGTLLKVFLGLGYKNSNLSENFPIPTKSLLNFAGLFWAVQRSCVGLIKILQTYFKIPVEIQEFTGSWIHFSSDRLSLLSTSQRYNVLGKNLILGTKGWDKASSFTISLGPLNLETFTSFLPINPICKSLCDLTSLYVRPDKCFDVELKIDPESVPPLALGQNSYLGWKTWLKTKPFGPNPGIVRLYSNSLPLLGA